MRRFLHRVAQRAQKAFVGPLVTASPTVGTESSFELFTGESNIEEVNVICIGLSSTIGNCVLELHLGTQSGYATNNYEGGAYGLNPAAGSGQANSSEGRLTNSDQFDAGAAGQTSIRIFKVGATRWAWSATMADTSGNIGHIANGSIDLGGDLDRAKLELSVGVFDGGACHYSLRRAA